MNRGEVGMKGISGWDTMLKVNAVFESIHIVRWKSNALNMCSEVFSTNFSVSSSSLIFDGYAL